LLTSTSRRIRSWRRGPTRGPPRGEPEARVRGVGSSPFSPQRRLGRSGSWAQPRGPSGCVRPDGDLRWSSLCGATTRVGGVPERTRPTTRTQPLGPPGQLRGSGSPRHGPGRSGSSAGAAGPSASSAAGHGGGGPAGRARARAGSLAGEAAQAPAARAHADWQGGAAAARSPRRRLQNRKLCERGGDAQQPEEAEEGVRPTQTEADVHTGSGRAVSREDHDEVTDDELAALMLRMPKGDNGELTSVGSTKHAEGTCKPCAFFSTQVGCQKGIRCDFCHILHRRKDRRRLGKQKRERYRDLISRVASGSKADPEPSRQSAGSSDQLPGG
ncbi:unnamed protein product, partial [Prorocentrum cordatum]